MLKMTAARKNPTIIFWNSGGEGEGEGEGEGRGEGRGRGGEEGKT